MLPLLWNMLVAIRIWTKLKRSIPPGLGQYYSLIPDPTAGKVTVVARTPMQLLSLSDQDFQRIRARVPELERLLRRFGVERAGR